MYADVVSWMFRNVGGLQNAGIAYDKCLLKPYFFADSCSASAKTETPRGLISFAWEKTGNRFVADAVIPEGTDAILELPGRTPVQVRSGKLEIQL
jgi:alpha-L-rhamnosidase